MKVYMDNCCYYRPFDDQTQDRILLEADAILAIIYRCGQCKLELIGSDILDYEMSNTKDTSKFQKANAMYSAATVKISLSSEIQERANQLQNFGLKPYDCLHLASAEIGGVDVYLTTDDNLIKWVKASDIKIQVFNPVYWLMEVMKNE